MAESIDDYIPEDQKLYALFKGEQATGKTPAACSWPNVLVLDVDERFASTKKYWGGKKSDIFVIRGLRNNYPKLMKTFEDLIRYNSYETIVVDSFTTIARSLATLMFESRGAGAQAKRDDNQRIYINAAKLPGKFDGIPKLEMDDFLTENNGLIQVLDAGSALWNAGNGCNVIFIAHVIEVENPTLKNDRMGNPIVRRTRGIMTGGRKIAAEIPIYFNEAYHFYRTLSNDYKIITKSDEEDWAKTALPLPNEIDFTNKSLYDEIMKFLPKFTPKEVNIEG